MDDSKKRWDFCVDHYGADVSQFYNEFFKDEKRKCLLIGGAGFDPRSILTLQTLHSIMPKRVTAFLIREERPNPDPQLKKRAENNITKLNEIGCPNTIQEIDIFADDNAVVGGNNVIQALKSLKFEEYTDVIIDLSALSIGVSFPIVAYVYQSIKQSKFSTNVHLNVVSSTELDSLISSSPNDRVTDIKGFSLRELLGGDEVAKLWLPLMSSGKKGLLNRIHSHVDPDDTCPIFPFPCEENPQKGDKLAIEYIQELEVTHKLASVAELENNWNVDPRNFVYADETMPLDIYRTVLRIDDERKPVFETFGGSTLILSPLGSRMPAIGLLMAALERNFPVVYVEALEYHVDWAKVDAMSTAKYEAAHVWLYGEAYHRDRESSLGNGKSGKI